MRGFKTINYLLCKNKILSAIFFAAALILSSGIKFFRDAYVSNKIGSSYIANNEGLLGIQFFAIIALIFLVINAFGAKLREDVEYSKTLPYSRFEIFINKNIFIYGTLLISMIINTIIKLMAVNIYKDLFMGVGIRSTDILMGAIQTFVILSLCISLITVSYILCKNAYIMMASMFSGMFIGIGVGFYLLVVSVSIAEMTSFKLGQNIIDILVDIAKYISGLVNFVVGVGINDEGSMANTIVVLILTIIITFIGYRFYRGIPSGDSWFKTSIFIRNISIAVIVNLAVEIYVVSKFMNNYNFDLMDISRLSQIYTVSILSTIVIIGITYGLYKLDRMKRQKSKQKDKMYVIN